MAFEFIEGFDTWATQYDGFGKGWTYTYYAASSGVFAAGQYKPNGSTYTGQALAAASLTVVYATKALKAPRSTVTIGSAVWSGDNGHPDSAFHNLLNVMNGTTSLAQVGFATSNGITINIVAMDATGSTHTIGSFTAAALGQPYYIEASFVAGVSSGGSVANGTVTVRVDGATIGTVSCPTNTEAMQTYDHVLYATPYSADANASMDHLYCTNAEGSINTGFAGPLVVQTIYDVADTGTQEWVPSSGSSCAVMVNEEIEDGNATYIQSNSAAQHSQFSIGSLDAALGQVMCVQPVITFTGAGNTVAATISSGGTVVTGTYESGSETFTAYSPDLYELDPGTDAIWTASAVGDIVLGVLNGAP